MNEIEYGKQFLLISFSWKIELVWFGAFEQVQICGSIGGVDSLDEVKIWGDFEGTVADFKQASLDEL